MFRARALGLLVLPLAAACAGSGGSSPPPTAWPPGTYYLEADVQGTGRAVFSADLYIEPDGRTMRLDNHRGGVCEPPTLDQLRPDTQQRTRGFTCGDVSYTIRNATDTVSGQIRADVEEDYRTTVCRERGPAGTCARSVSVVRTRTVTKIERLRVLKVE